MNTAMDNPGDDLLASRPGDERPATREAADGRSPSTLRGPHSADDPSLEPMWIDRLDRRISDAIDQLQHPGYVLAGGVAACLLLLFMFATVVSGQVERGQLRNMEEAALRAELWRCSALTGAAGDRCRQVARGEEPSSPLVSWDSLPPVSGSVNGAVVPVSLR